MGRFKQQSVLCIDLSRRRIRRLQSVEKQACGQMHDCLASVIQASAQERERGEDPSENLLLYLEGCSNALVVSANLSRRNVSYPCSSLALQHCPDDSHSLAEWWISIVHHLCLQPEPDVLVLHFASILWHMWKTRDEKLFAQSSYVLSQASAFAIKAWLVWPTVNPTLQIVVPSIWEPPVVGFLKINCDGAFSNHGSLGGVTAVDRDSDGWVVDFCVQISDCGSPLMAKAKAICLGILLAHEHHWKNIIVESDSLNLILARNSPKGSFPLEVPILMEDLKASLNGFDKRNLPTLHYTVSVAEQISLSHSLDSYSTDQVISAFGFSSFFFEAMDLRPIFMAPLFLHALLIWLPFAFAGHDYGQALSNSILFFEAQRSGYLPGNQRVKWRADSGLHDGKANGVDLVGGYYDAGDNVKFGLPMAFTITMMSWSIVEYGKQMAASGELGHAMEAVKWGTDYLIKAHPQSNVLFGEVGDGNSDHYCWQRPEDMSTDRRAYKIDPSNPGSDLAGETAAAMAAASLVFRHQNPAYANDLLNHATQHNHIFAFLDLKVIVGRPGPNVCRQESPVIRLVLFEFADKYRGKYDSSIRVAQKYYQSYSGYADELLWAASWLYQATNNQYYLDYLGNNGDSLGGTGWAMTQFGWDVKYAGVQVLAAKFLMQGRGGHHSPVFEKYQQKADYFMCSCLGKGSRNVHRTPGGLLFRQRWNNMQFVTSASFLLTIYSDYLTSAGKNLKCAAGNVSPSELLSFAKSQVDYILGDNPRATSYMVGYGSNYPRQVHHRGSSIVSIKVNPSFVTCRGGYATWFSSKASDPNLLTGAIVGGPDAYDNFADERDNYEQTEPATYNNAPLLGILARLKGGHSGYNQLLPVILPAPKPVISQPKPTPAPAKSYVQIAIEQKATASWNAKGRTYYRYSTVVTNRSSKNVKDLKLSISKLYGPLWGLTRSGGSYVFPAWLNSLPAGKSLEFVYIHSASPADISVSDYTLA
ncbi:hypothetical protein HHK36_001295 [Tetracentron sinense]|uniref:Endoglucanase n=1 Tax=Tetracentron sinense TaxID=13715 RepID=A0A835A3E5_TETSI|nr:hypothetical protein HHK36_001295 [Tetracentron sinense]